MDQNQKKVKVKKRKVTEKDIQRNIERIQAKLEKVEPGTPEYKTLSEALEHEYVVLKKFKDSRFIIQPKDALTIGAFAVTIIFFTCLEREVPAATKFAGLVLKMVPFKG